MQCLDQTRVSTLGGDEGNGSREQKAKSPTEITIPTY